MIQVKRVTWCRNKNQVVSIWRISRLQEQLSLQGNQLQGEDQKQQANIPLDAAPTTITTTATTK